MNKVTNYLKHLVHLSPGYLSPIFITVRSIAANVKEKNIAECYQILNVPKDANQNEVRKAFLEMAKKYHPDSGSPFSDREKFIYVENAFRTLTKHNTGSINHDEVEKIVYNIKHTAPQHRQYLSYEGLGFGTIFQREKQFSQARAQRAATNVMEHRIEKAVAAENTLMKKGQGFSRKHDIKTKYGFDRLVEDLIQESMSKGEFENLSGKGKPLKNQNNNPYVDFTTHKLNEVLINNGFTPEWITLAKEIDTDIAQLEQEIRSERVPLGPFPMTEQETVKWHQICESNKKLAMSINKKINSYNLIVPILNRQKFYVQFDKMCDDVLKNGAHSANNEKTVPKPIKKVNSNKNSGEDFFSTFFRTVVDILTFKRDANEKL
ncbi:unnamed protein product [Chrysodeixis includens]|uniref:J domain-containing protein n=1 Tax=Chrysodeixis includens TaxID=689277 RepID=A0A9P0BJ17_CHRIL|nr:unnamed protein product [Chrysodeixis includens]